MVSYMVSKRVLIPLFLSSPRDSFHSCLTHVAGPSMKSVGPAREGECWEVPRRPSPKLDRVSYINLSFWVGTWFLTSFRFHWQVGSRIAPHTLLLIFFLFFVYLLLAFNEI
eukprot:TRINITY_DN19274_c1_g3_i1.p1 TRINITY_DN19274_c1_g3~~TRINITY_DN19274_c1_g3_i1.p1  ORF type:complete len:111 (+),score=2.43 TRINITY_DN19274_c1_g3_i1:64-396(+)